MRDIIGFLGFLLMISSITAAFYYWGGIAGLLCIIAWLLACIMADDR